MSIYYHHGDTVEFSQTVVALGTFDGLHRAHMKIIKAAERYAVKAGLKWGVMLFDIIPANAVGARKAGLLMTNDEKKEILSGADFFYTESFDSDFYGKSPEEFINYLKCTLHASAVSVGYNYRFGNNAAGDVRLLEELCKNAGIKVLVTEKTELDGQVVSSTVIRELVAEGRVDEASEFLGRNFFITGDVESGLQNGRKMGIPTANIHAEGRLLPKSGVYSGYCTFDGIRRKAIINVGSNPTFGGSSVTIEGHILDFDGDIYGKGIKAEFVRRLRDEQKFKSSEELAARIKKDIEQCRKELK
ncbi:MAG: bifunctional riboflavin kinase/FAD synthetase [Clostridia bacterium]|nr:bifunctional riboflavin kinase/FAD synthetase [Clostridia bacterium]